MFKNDSSPISLFSFQDIVTSLTGIMVLIILLLAIELLQTRESVPQPEPSLSKELQHAKIQQEQLQKTLQQLEQQFEQQRNQAHILTTCDPATLPEQIQNTLAALAQENQLHLRLNTQHQILKNQIDTASSQLPNTPQELKKTIDELFQQNQAVTAESHALQKQLQEAQARLERKQKQLEFSFTGKDDRTPVLIECAQAGVRFAPYTKDASPQEISIAPNPGTFLQRVNRALQEFPKHTHYFVFLIKPSSRKFAQDLVDSFQEHNLGASLGMEPILEQEECF